MKGAMVKYLKFLVLVPLLLVSCSKTINIGAFSLGERKANVVNVLEKENGRIENVNNNTIRYIGELRILDISWDKVFCIFEKDKLVEVKATREYASLSEKAIKNLKDQLGELCGYGYNSTNPQDLIACYGDSKENNGCLGAILIDLDNNTFFLRLYLSDYDSNR